VRAVHVADGADPDIGVREQLAEPAHAHAADPDHAEHDLIVRALTRQDAPVESGHRGEAARDRPEEHSPGNACGCHQEQSFPPE
jgi:hypothetical protein